MTQLDLTKPTIAPIDIAIVNYNAREHLRECLATVQPEALGKIIVVDNASSDGSVEMVPGKYPNVLLYANKYGVTIRILIVNSVRSGQSCNLAVHDKTGAVHRLRMSQQRIRQ